ncbi:hypothetical protein R6Q59_029521 [Mikania micrantha]
MESNPVSDQKTKDPTQESIIIVKSWNSKDQNQENQGDHNRRFGVGGAWFTFKKRRPPKFPYCVSKVLHCLHDWKPRYLSVLNEFLLELLPLLDINITFDDEAPLLRDCDLPMFRLLAKNPTQAIVFPEPILVMDGVSALWDDPYHRRKAMQDRERSLFFFPFHVYHLVSLFDLCLVVYLGIIWLYL